MYKPFSKSIKEISKSNTWERAVYQYVNYPLSGEIPEPKTRIEQLAKAFVFDETTAGNIQKLKEINRCIAACEAYDNYEKEKDSYQNVCVPQIRVISVESAYKSEYEHASDNSSEEVSVKNDNLETNDAQSVQSLLKSGKAEKLKDSKEEQLLTDETYYVSKDVNIKDLPVLTELSSLQDICKVLYRLTKIEDFKVVPIDSQGVQLLLSKLTGENGTKIYRSLPDKFTPTFKRAIEYLHNHFELLQEKECQKQTKEKLKDIAILKRV